MTNNAEFTKQWESVKERLEHVALHIMHNRSDVDDVLQNTAISAFRGFDGFRGDSCFYTWSYRILMNSIISHLRKKRRENTVPFTDTGDITFSNPPTDRSHYRPDREAEYHELEEQYKDRIKEDTNGEELIRHIEGLDYEDIAKEKGVAVGTIKSRIARTRERLRKDYPF